jgi:hypothetical protein
MSMQDPGLDRHDWAGRLESLEEDLRDEPAQALPELADLVQDMLEETGYDLADPVALEGDEREVLDEYRAAREVGDRVERGDTVDPGELGAAIRGLRTVADYLTEQRSL